MTVDRVDHLNHDLVWTMTPDRRRSFRLCVTCLIVLAEESRPPRPSRPPAEAVPVHEALR